MHGGGAGTERVVRTGDSEGEGDQRGVSGLVDLLDRAERAAKHRNLRKRPAEG